MYVYVYVFVYTVHAVYMYVHVYVYVYARARACMHACTRRLHVCCIVSKGPVCGRNPCSRPGCVPALGLMGWCYRLLSGRLFERLSERESGTATCLVAFWF